MQFIMGLNESFDNVHSQILLLDALPSVNKVYSMVLRIEKSREVIDIFAENAENNALFVRSPSHKPPDRTGSHTNLAYPKGPPRGYGDCRGFGSRFDLRKPFRHCDYCNSDGHVKDTCFHLHE